MGARPLAAFLSLALPKRTPQAWINRYFNGLRELADRSKVPLAGGDTAAAPGAELLADIVLVGSAPRGTALRRSGARPGDLLYCTGSLGGAAAELLDLQELTGKRKGSSGSAPGSHPQLFPEPRLGVGEALRRRRLATACMDLSDGLSSDLRHLCEASEVAAVVELSRLPVHPLAARRGGSAMGLVLDGGEDYELLFAARPGTRVPGRIAGVPITRIGHLRSLRGIPQVTQIGEDGRESEMLRGGWEHRLA
jgi:thiamine-monophosphate kinase